MAERRKRFCAAVREAAVNAGIEAILQPTVQGRQLRIGNVETWRQAVTDGLMNVGLAGALGFTFGAGGKALERIIGVDKPPAQDVDADFAKARESLKTLAAVTAERDDPEGAALVRKALAEAERDYATARQLPDGIDADEFILAVEAADAKVRGLAQFSERPEPPVPYRDARPDDPPPPEALSLARALRDAPATDIGTIPAPAAVIREARQLARLSPDVFDMVDRGALDRQYAVLVEQVAPGDAPTQRFIAGELVRRAPETWREAEDAVSEALIQNADPRSRETGPSRAREGRQSGDVVAAASEWLSGPRSVLKALADSGDLARAMGVEAAGLDPAEASQLAIAALLHARQPQTRTAVSEMLGRAMEAVRSQGVRPSGRASSWRARSVTWSTPRDSGR